MSNDVQVTGTRVGIIGCGMAGPVLAMFLKKRGYDPVIYERNESVSSGGLAIAIQENGRKVLRLLPEVLDTLPGQDIHSMLLLSSLLYKDAAASSPPAPDEQNQTHRRDSQIQIPQSAVLGRMGDPKRAGGAENNWSLRCVQRDVLLAHYVRYAQAMGISIKWGWRLVGVEEVDTKEDKGEVEMAFANGQIERASFVIGCDGLHSAVRTALFGKEEPRFTGIVQTGGFAPILPSDPVRKHTFFQCYGLNAHFVSPPVSDTLRCWVISSREEETKESWRSLDEETKQAFLADQAKREWGLGIDEIIGNTQNLVKYGLYDRPELKTWHKGRIVLLGDAAHPFTPHLGQGANQGYEDIYHLVLSLQKSHPLPFSLPTNRQLSEAFSRYESIRMERTAMLVARARQYGDDRVESDWEKAKRRDEEVRKRLADEEGVRAERADYSKGPYEGESEIVFN